MVLCLIGKGTSNKPPNMSTMFANVSGPWLQSLCQINTGQTAVRFRIPLVIKQSDNFSNNQYVHQTYLLWSGHPRYMIVDIVCSIINHEHFLEAFRWYSARCVFLSDYSMEWSGGEDTGYLSKYSAGRTVIGTFSKVYQLDKYYCLFHVMMKGTRDWY